MRAEEQTSRHLLLAVITTVFSGMLSLVAIVLGWEFWVIPMMMAGGVSVWLMHIGRLGSNRLYENLCAGLMLTEFFFFGVHESSLFDLPAVACVLTLVLFMLNKKRILYTLTFLYILALLYHGLVFHTISYQMGGPGGLPSGAGYLHGFWRCGPGVLLGQPAERTAEVV